MTSALVKPWAERHGIDLNVAYCVAEAMRGMSNDIPFAFTHWTQWAHTSLCFQFPDERQRATIIQELYNGFVQRGVISG